MITYVIPKALLGSCIATFDGNIPEREKSFELAMEVIASGSSTDDFVMLQQVDEPKVLAEARKIVVRYFNRQKKKVNLTRRETEVLAEVVRGMSNKEIGSCLHLSERTIKFHVSALLAKFDVHSRTELAVKNKKIDEEEIRNELELDSLSRDEHRLPSGAQDPGRGDVRRRLPHGLDPHPIVLENHNGRRGGGVLRRSAV